MVRKTAEQLCARLLCQTDAVFHAGGGGTGSSIKTEPKPSAAEERNSGEMALSKGQLIGLTGTCTTLRRYMDSSSSLERPPGS